MSTHSQIDADHVALGRAAVFSVSRAAELLPIRDCEARAWLRDRGLIRDLVGRSVVVWGDVLDALEDDRPNRPRTSPRTRRFALPRNKL